MLHRTRNIGFSGLALTLATLGMAATSAQASVSATGFQPAKTAGQLQSQVDEQLAATVGGTQIAPNKVAYNGGNVVMVFPPVGQASRTESTAAAASGCPAGSNESSRWMCFYDGVNWDPNDRVLQFKDCPGTQLFSTYNFQNKTTSWANTKHDHNVYVYQGSSSLLWTEGTQSSSNYVGAGLDNRADRFSC